ncbi:MAG TPA: hypothetical protein VH280_06830 [Verrucomicrobiae bacterium]|jgi:hypothetical protein|nr:hypothetical protein [Verrucomicrobiae bacterium]
MISLSPNPRSPRQTRLLIKELAEALGVSTRFIYVMRARGFPMRGDTHQRQMATVAEASAWIRANNFRIINGTGVIDRRRTPQPKNAPPEATSMNLLYSPQMAK